MPSFFKSTHLGSKGLFRSVRTKTGLKRKQPVFVCWPGRDRQHLCARAGPVVLCSYALSRIDRFLFFSIPTAKSINRLTDSTKNKATKLARQSKRSFEVVLSQLGSFAAPRLVAFSLKCEK